MRKVRYERSSGERGRKRVKGQRCHNEPSWHITSGQVPNRRGHGWRRSRPLGVTGAEPTRRAGEHSLHILNREQVTIQGVLSVESFDDEEIILETDLGTLTLRGEDLHIRQLDLESGRFAVEGYVSICTYSTPRQRGGRTGKPRGFLERLLK
jgi:sporulation protein YabP